MDLNRDKVADMVLKVEELEQIVTEGDMSVEAWKIHRELVQIRTYLEEVALMMVKGQIQG